MKTFVLILMMSTGSYQGGVAIHSQEYASSDACDLALAQAVGAAPDRTRVTGSCSPKGKDTEAVE